MTALMLLLAYILPLPIMAACFYFQVFSSIDDMTTRLIAIGITSIVPSAILMLFVLKRILHLIFTILCIAGILFALQHFGLINFPGHEGSP
jgi:hypothetical protein